MSKTVLHKSKKASATQEAQQSSNKGDLVVFVGKFFSLQIMCIINSLIYYSFISTAKRCSKNSPTQRSNPSQPDPTYSSRVAKTLKRSMMWYIFEKEIVQGPQKQWSQVSDTQIHKYKYTNTQYTNTVLVKLSDTPIMWYIFEKVMVRGLQKQCSQVKTKKT